MNIRIFLALFPQRDSARYRAGRRAKVQKVQKAIRKGGKRKK